MTPIYTTQDGAGLNPSKTTNPVGLTFAFAYLHPLTSKALDVTSKVDAA